MQACLLGALHSERCLARFAHQQTPTRDAFWILQRKTRKQSILCCISCIQAPFWDFTLIRERHQRDPKRHIIGRKRFQNRPMVAYDLCR